MNLANPDIVLQYRMPRGRPSKEVSERRRRALLPLAGKGWAEVMPFRTEVPLPTPTSAQKKPGASAVTSSLDPTPMRIALQYRDVGTRPALWFFAVLQPLRTG